jgi:hypothetical protein
MLTTCPHHQVHAQHNALLDAAHEFREELPPEVADCLSIGSAMRLLWADVSVRRALYCGQGGFKVGIIIIIIIINFTLPAQPASGAARANTTHAALDQDGSQLRLGHA